MYYCSTTCTSSVKNFLIVVLQQMKIFLPSRMIGHTQKEKKTDKKGLKKLIYGPSSSTLPPGIRRAMLEHDAVESLWLIEPEMWFQQQQPTTPTHKIFIFHFLHTFFCLFECCCFLTTDCWDSRGELISILCKVVKYFWPLLFKKLKRSFRWSIYGALECWVFVIIA